MRFMVIVKASKESEAGVMPTAEELTAMGRFNEELIKAGVLLDGAGLKPTSHATRIVFDGKKRTVIDGPFTETKELVAGYWILECKSKEEVIEWMKKCPNTSGDGGSVEIRPYFEPADFDNAPRELVEREFERLEQQRKR